MAYKKKTWDSGDQVTHNDLNKWETALDEHDKEIVKLPSFKEDIQKQIGVLFEKVNNLQDNAFDESNVYNDLPMGRSLFLSTGNFGGINSCNVLIEKTRWYAMETIYRNDTEYVKYNIKYRIMSNTQSTWGEWKATATSDEITALQDKIDWKQDDFKTESALPSEYDNKKTTIFFARTQFNGYPYSIVKVTKYNDNFCRMQLIGEDNQPLCYRLSNKGAWGKWQSIATTDKVDIPLPYNAEFITNEENRYVSKLVKDSLNKVTAYVSVKRTDGQMFKANTDYQIAILPNGWKNKGNNQCLGSASNLNGISIGSARIAVFDGTLFATTFTDCYCMMFTTEYELII